MTNLLIIINLFNRFRFFLYFTFLFIAVVKGLISSNIYYCDGIDITDNNETYLEPSSQNDENVFFIQPAINYNENESFNDALRSAFGYVSDLNVTGEATIDEILSLYDRDDSDNDSESESEPDLFSESETVNEYDAMNYPEHPAYRNYVGNKSNNHNLSPKKEVRFRDSVNNTVIKYPINSKRKVRELNWNGTRYTRTNFEKKYPTIYYDLKRKFFWKVWEKDRNNFNDYKEFRRGWDPRINIFKIVTKEKSKDIRTKVENLINSKNPFDIDRSVKSKAKRPVKR